MSSSEIVVRVNGWDLVSESGKVEESRIVDTDLAGRLEISEPRMIRRIIKRLRDDGHLPEIHVRSRNERTQMPTGGVRETTVEEYLLNEEEALLVTTQSKTAKAMAVTKEMIAVFVALRRGLFSPPSAPSPELMEALSVLSTLAKAVQELQVSVASRPAQAPSNGQELGRQDGDEVRTKIRQIASNYAIGTPNPKAQFASWRSKIDREMRRQFNHDGYGSSWNNLPQYRRPELMRSLNAKIAESEKIAQSRWITPQLPLKKVS